MYKSVLIVFSTVGILWLWISHTLARWGRVAFIRLLGALILAITNVMSFMPIMEFISVIWGDHNCQGHNFRCLSCNCLIPKKYGANQTYSVWWINDGWMYIFFKIFFGLSNIKMINKFTTKANPKEYIYHLLKKFS